MATNSENNKRIAKNTLLLYFRTFITLIIALYTSRVILQVLGVTDFGIYNVVGGFVSMFSLISASLTISTQRFITFELGRKKNSHPQEIFSTAIIIHFIIAIIIVILAESIGVWFLNEKMVIDSNRLNAANWIFQLSLATFIINLISIPYNSMIIAHEKMTAFAYISLLEAFLKIIIVFMLTIITFDKLIAYGILLFLVSIIIRLIYSIYCSKNFQECHFIFVKEKVYYQQILSFSGWNIIGSSSGILINYGLNILLNLFFGVTLNAARGIATQVDNAVNQFVSNFTMAINPQITKSFAAKDYSYMMSLVMRGSKYSYYLLLIMALPLLFETDYILKIWLKEVPDYTIIFTRLSLLYMLFQSISNTLYTAMLATGKIRNYQIIVGGISLIAFPVTYILFYYQYPPEFCYYTMLFTSMSCLIARLLMLKYMINLPLITFIREVLYKIFIVSLCSSIIPFLISKNFEESGIRLITNTLSTVIITIFVIYFLGIKKEEKLSILQSIKTIKRKIIN